MTGRTWVLALLVSTSLLAIGRAEAADPTGAAGDAAEAPADWSYDMWNELMSPFCPGRSLADCPSDRADSLRMWIQVQESAGRTPEDVESELLERYGEQILSAPRARGFGVTAYLVPIVVFLGGGVVVAVFLRRQTAAVAATPATPRVLDPELERQVDKDLAR